MPAGLAVLGHADRGRSLPRRGVSFVAGAPLRISVRSGALARRCVVARPAWPRAASRDRRPSRPVRARYLPVRIARHDRRSEERIRGPWSATRPSSRRRVHFSAGVLMMNLFSKLVVLAAVAMSAATATAQTYPDKPVRVVVTTVPGPLDAFARVVLQQIEKRLKQTFIVDNRAGAGGNLGADIVVKSPADGYTLLFALDTTFTVNPWLYRKMPFDVTKDFTIISVPVTYSQALAVNPNVKATSVAEFVNLAKSTHMSYASGGNGSPSHLTMA